MLLIIEIAAVVVSLTAAFIMTFGKPQWVWLSMLLWTSGSVLWGLIGLLTNNWALVIVNIGFFILEGIGFIRWVKRRTKHD